MLKRLGREKAYVLSLFYALTGCDTSAFLGRGKLTAWETWNGFPELTSALLALHNALVTVEEDHLRVFERFAILLHDCATDQARKNLLAKRNLAEKIPPTIAALLHAHVKTSSMLRQPHMGSVSICMTRQRISS